ncbi:ChbG/HpnK family deacetylase [Shimazuella sp. AN120528]|uniref:ChbG/HpnK family deacetylase n=1 Tax=Shimazuella soli TaxID=1892854 RepID=UPI001F10F10B|nr:ChbG/HpnK family deacetylase [Shimazuella soli]MCH5586337.1 ChbG/HpnK family deacetylase [Shimazuella soli]
MKKLVINADDLGLDWDRDLGILLGIWLGVISSVSAIVTNKQSHDRLHLFVKWIRKFRPQVSVGLHLNLTDEPLNCCELGNIIGQSLNSQVHPKVAYWKSALKALINMEAISEEIASQIDVFRRVFDSKPEHLDGHNHCHIAHPLIFEEVRNQAHLHGIHHIRIPNESLTKDHKDLYRWIEKIRNNTEPEPLAESMRENLFSDLFLYDYSCSQLSPISSKTFIGSIYGHIRSFSFLKQNIDQAFQTSSLLELMVHPGLQFPISHATWFSNFDRVHELWNLLRLRFYLRKQNIQIVNHDEKRI